MPVRHVPVEPVPVAAAASSCIQRQALSTRRLLNNKTNTSISYVTFIPALLLVMQAKLSINKLFNFHCPNCSCIRKLRVLVTS